jgi:hypothetical protein
MRPCWPLAEERAMFGGATKRWLRGVWVAAVAGIGLATVVSAAPARAEFDLSIAIPGVSYYTPPPAFASSHWYQPVMGGVYLGFGNYHHHYW